MKKPLALTGGFRLGGLPYFHPLPAQKAVNVVYEECGKAHHDADIHGIFHTRHDPQHYQTTSFAAYARAKKGLLLKVRCAARKLVVTEMVPGTMLAVLKCAKMK